jgi:hypothetical protein
MAHPAVSEGFSMCVKSSEFFFSNITHTIIHVGSSPQP